MSVFQSGSAETAKATAHLALGACAALCFTYNVCAYFCRTAHRRHLAINAVVYGALVAYEIRVIHHHWRAR